MLDTARPRGVTLAALRAGTTAAHRRLDEGLSLLDPAITTDAYRRLLCRFRGALAATEPAIDVAAARARLGLPAPPGRPRVERLDADLTALGLTPDAIARLPRPGSPPALSGAGAIGYLYVWEGAALGGAVIARHVGRTLGLTRASGAAFFGGDHAEIGPRWRAFTVALDTLRTTPAELDAIVAGARDTFEFLESWLLAPVV
jgi:heme oxygenase (biliverdin-IX-beta and delta-forming)